VTSFFTDVRNTLLPKAGSPHGPLPPLLVGLTVVSGLVDAFSYLELGRVFVANMTGNVVVLGFALAGAAGFSVAGSALALAVFIVGALVGGVVVRRMADHRGHLLAIAAGLETLLFAGALAVAALAATPFTSAARYPMIAVLALALGLQNAAARRLAVPGLTTTVLTLTITGAAADVALGQGHGVSIGRGVVSVIALFAGALVGALFIVHVRVSLPLGLATLVLATVSVASLFAGRARPSWVTP
jgi:uncharacterized membrane protein YoaK (UPF0700 family)